MLREIRRPLHGGYSIGIPSQIIIPMLSSKWALFPFTWYFFRADGPLMQTVENIHRIEIRDAYLASLSDGNELAIYHETS